MKIYVNGQVIEAERCKELGLSLLCYVPKLGMALHGNGCVFDFNRLSQQ
jgi:hypothetical protein